MTISRQVVTVFLLLIPTLFAVALFGQGVVKLSKNDADGANAFGFGVFSLVLIAAAYFLFMR